MPHLDLLSPSLNKRKKEALDCTLRMLRNARLRCIFLFKNCDKCCKMCDFLAIFVYFWGFCEFFKFLDIFERLLQTYVRFP